MADVNCICCGGTGFLVDGSVCTECSSGNDVSIELLDSRVPVQYQGIKFDKSFLPSDMQKDYGTYMEDLLQSIVKDYSFYQKNLLICARPNSGKTVWAYNLYSLLSAKGCIIPVFRDIVETRAILNSYTDRDECELISKAKCLVVKLPSDMQYWMIDYMTSIIEKRVRNSGFTIFLYGGSYEFLQEIDKNKRLKHMVGTGAYNTVHVANYWRS